MALRLELERTELVPGDEVAVRLSAGDDLTRVRAARVELGFVNRFRYRWAGKRDAAMVEATDALTFIDPTSPGTTHGTDKDAEEWIPVLGEYLPVADGRLAAGDRRLQFRLPSWSPPSSRELARWAIRAHVERARARDGKAEAELTVLAPRPAEVGETAQIRLNGGTTEVEVRLDDSAVRPGERLRGSVALTPAKEVSPVTVKVYLVRQRLSHPVSRPPAGAVADHVVNRQLGKKQPLPPRVRTQLPFELEVPADAAPTGEAPNSAIRWWVEAWALYAAFSAARETEKVRREVVVYNAPA